MATRETSRPTTIFIWIVPRTCSTILAKCMTFVEGTQIWMEPYCASYTKETFFNPEYKKDDPRMGKIRAMEAEIRAGTMMQAILKQTKELPNVIDEQEISYEWVKAQLEIVDPETKFVIVKDQSFAIADRLDFLPDIPNCRHAFMIRHPRDAFFSLKKVITKLYAFSWERSNFSDGLPFLPVNEFFETHHRLWKRLQGVDGHEPVIIDGFDLTTRPEDILPKFFAKLGIPFESRYLTWDESDEVITRKWGGGSGHVLFHPKQGSYSRAANSSKFDAPKNQRGTPLESDPPNTPELTRLINDAMPFYEEMYAQRVK